MLPAHTSLIFRVTGSDSFTYDDASVASRIILPCAGGSLCARCPARADIWYVSARERRYPVRDVRHRMPSRTQAPDIWYATSAQGRECVRGVMHVHARCKVHVCEMSDPCEPDPCERSVSLPETHRPQRMPMTGKIVRCLLQNLRKKCIFVFAIG